MKGISQAVHIRSFLKVIIYPSSTCNTTGKRCNLAQLVIDQKGKLLLYWPLSSQVPFLFPENLDCPFKKQVFYPKDCTLIDSVKCLK